MSPEYAGATVEKSNGERAKQGEGEGGSEGEENAARGEVRRGGDGETEKAERTSRRSRGAKQGVRPPGQERVLKD